MIEPTQTERQTVATTEVAPNRRARQMPDPSPGTGEFEKILRQQRTRQQAQRAQQQAQAQPAGHDVVFSRHAQQRLQKRDIHLVPAQSQRLEQAIHSAADRGAQQSLVVLDGIAFIVNVRQRTVVTALDVDNRNNTVFTNIDSAVVA